MKRYLSLLFFALFFLSLKAEQPDSLVFSNASWRVEIVAPGLIYKSYHFTDSTLFSSNQFISLLEINPDLRRIEILPSPELKETSALALGANAIAAVNGSFFKFNYTKDTITYNSVDYIRKNFIQIAPNTFKEKGKREQHQLGALAVLDNNLYILKADSRSDWEKYIYAKEVITTGPLLIKAGKPENLLKSSFYTTRHPRTAIIKKSNGTIIFMTIDGRAAESSGVSLEELTFISRWLGAVDAINLDGGGSTTMFVKDKNSTGVVNHPCDNKKFDNQGERKVANAIIIL